MFEIFLFIIFLFIASMLFAGIPALWQSLLCLGRTPDLFIKGQKPLMQSLLTDSLLFIPLIIVIVSIQYLMPLEQVNYFPLSTSHFIKWNFLVLLFSIIGLAMIKKIDKRPEVNYKNIFWIVGYICIAYLTFIIVLMATLVIGMNAFPDNTLSYYPYVPMKINPYVIYPLFIVQILFIWIALSLKSVAKVVLTLAYTFILMIGYYEFYT